MLDADHRDLSHGTGHTIAVEDALEENPIVDTGLLGPDTCANTGGGVETD